jgi:hypothetical protein
MLGLLHTADWQIGKLVGQFEPDQAALRASFLAAPCEAQPHSHRTVPAGQLEIRGRVRNFPPPQAIRTAVPLTATINIPLVSPSTS